MASSIHGGLQRPTPLSRSGTLSDIHTRTTADHASRSVGTGFTKCCRHQRSVRTWLVPPGMLGVSLRLRALLEASWTKRQQAGSLGVCRPADCFERQIPVKLAATTASQSSSLPFTGPAPTKLARAAGRQSSGFQEQGFDHRPRASPRQRGETRDGGPSEGLRYSREDEDDVIGAWRSEILGGGGSISGGARGSTARNRGAAANTEATCVDEKAEGISLGESPSSNSEKPTRDVTSTENAISEEDSVEEDFAEAIERKTALAARLTGLPADVSIPSGPPAKEVLAGLRNPPWKRLIKEAESSSNTLSGDGEETEGSVLSEGDRWRQEQLKLHLEYKARLRASRMAENSGRGQTGPRKDMARVRRSRGLEGPGAERRHSQPGHVTVARAAMFSHFNAELHEEIKRLTGEEAEVSGDRTQSVCSDRNGSELTTSAEEGALGPVTDSVVLENEVGGGVGPRAPSLLKSALAAGSISELQDLLAAHEAATSDVLDGETGSVLVRELAWAEKPDLADIVFRMLCESGNEPNAQACRALVASAHKKEDFRLTLRVFSMARVRGIIPDRPTCMAALESCHRLGRWREAKSIFSDMLRTGLEPDTLAYNALIMAVGGARETREVQIAWAGMQKRGVRPNQQTYGLLISTFTKAELAEDALGIYERLTKVGLQPSAIMYEGLVVLLCRAKRDRLALNFYREMRLAGCVLSPRGHAVLLSALAKGWVLDWESALEVYANMKSDRVPLDVHHLTALLKVLALSRQTEAALDTWQEFRAAGVAPNLACYNSVIGVLRVAHDYDRAMDFFWEMKDAGISPDHETYGNLLWACSEPGLYKTALKLFEDMKISGVKPNTHAFTGLYTVMGRAGEWQTALELWKEMRALGIKPSTKTYNAMIGCLGRCRKPELMLKAHRQMLDEGVRSDDTTRHFLGKFGPPGAGKSFNSWGHGNLMGQRVPLKHYAREGEPRADVPSDSDPVNDPGEGYRRPGVVRAMRSEDSGWVRLAEERKVAAELREAKSGTARVEGLGESGNDGGGEWEEKETDGHTWVSGNQERFAEGEDERGGSFGRRWRGGEEGGRGERSGKGRGGVRKEGRRGRMSGQDDVSEKAVAPREDPRDVNAYEDQEDAHGLKGVAASKRKKAKGKASEDEGVPLWQII